MGTRAAAFSSSNRAKGSAGAHKLGGNLLKDIRHGRMYVSTLNNNCILNLLLKTTGKPHLPGNLEVEFVKVAAILCQKKFEFLFKG